MDVIYFLSQSEGVRTEVPVKKVFLNPAGHGDCESSSVGSLTVILY